MKRRVVSVGILVFWMLLVCTVLSGKIEELMTVQFVPAKAEQMEKDGVFWWALPSDFLIEGENGKGLYRAVKKEGWEEGLRAELTDPSIYQVEGESLLFPGESYDQYLGYASRPVAEGDLLEICVPRPDGEDVLLIVTRGVSEKSPAIRKQAEEETEEAILIIRERYQPFLESQARAELGISDDSRIYSLEELKGLFQSLPVLAGMGILLVLSILLWCHSFRMLKELRNNRLRIAADAGAGILFFWAFLELTGGLSLPSSLLPMRNILEVRHYIRETGEVLEILKQFSSPSAQEAANGLFWNLAGAGAVIGSGIFVFAGFMYVQRRYMRCTEQ